MKIQVGKYTLHSDQFAFWVTERQPAGAKAKKTEYVDVRVGGYCTNLKSLIRSFGENQLKMSDATDMEELLKDIERITEDMLNLNEEAVKQGLKLARKKRGIDE